MANQQNCTFSSNSTFKHPKVRWKVIEYLLHQMLDQSLLINESLPGIDELCETLGVSRTAVREAINVLVAKGMVASKPGEGSFIQPLSSWMLLDPEVLAWLRESDLALSIIEHLMEVRLIVEPEAAALASLRGTMEQFMAMNDALGRMSSGESLRTPESIQGDIDFHNLILSTSGNIFLSRLRDLCMVSVELVVRLTFERVESVADSIENHKRLLDAITLRQPDLAREESRRVLGKTVQDLQQINIPFRRDILQQLGEIRQGEVVRDSSSLEFTK